MKSLMSILFVALILGLVSVVGNCDGAAPSAQAPVIEMQPGEPSSRIMTVNVDSAPLVRIEPLSEGRNWAWQGTNAAFQSPAADGSVPFTWQVPGMGIDGTGSYQTQSPTAASWKWNLTMSQAWDLVGTDPGLQPHCGVTVFLDLTSGARRGCTSDPVLKPDKTGITWEMLSGKTITIDFATPLNNLYFEQGNKNQIRCTLYAAPMTAGTKYNQTMTVTLPNGAEVVPSAAVRYAADTKDWFVDALNPNTSFVDLSYLNEKPAGKHGFLKSKGDQFVFADGTPVRLWGVNVAAYSLYARTPDGKPNKAEIDVQAKRLAQLGFNLVRLTHVDSQWVQPNMIAPGPTSDKLNDASVDEMFYWIKALKDNGIYVWLDMATYRPFQPGDNIPGWDEISAAYGNKAGNILGEGFSYLNPRIQELWMTTTKELLTRANPYTGLALKDEPSVAGVMVWNENTFTGVNVYAIKPSTPWHWARFQVALKAFAAKTGFPESQLTQVWAPGPAKYLMNDIEHQWTSREVQFIRDLGFKGQIMSGQVWAPVTSSCLPALTAGDVIDSHGYSSAEFINCNPHYVSSAFQSFAWAHLADHPKTISEYNIGDSAEPQLDAFATLPYLASQAAFQGYAAPMLFAYTQDGMNGGNGGYSPWDSYKALQTIGMSPAAALIYREGHVRPASQTIYLSLTPKQVLDQDVNEQNSLTIRTVQERHRLLLGISAIKELDWFKPTVAPAGAETVTDLQRDFIPPGDEVVSDTGELKRNWVKGIYTIDTPKTQLVMGLLKGETIHTAGAVFTITSPKAAVALSSVDNKPISGSRHILVTTIGRVVNKDGHTLSEPVGGTVDLTSTVANLQLVPLKNDGSKMASIPLQRKNGVYHIVLPTTLGTHWFVLTGE